MGGWNDDLRCGFGKMQYRDGDVFEGNWLSDIKNGPGSLHFEEGGRYVGTWEEDKPLPGGKYYTDEGDRYEGEFRDLRRHGTGISENADSSVYEGQWSENEMSGNGTLTYRNGDVYEGGFLNGKREGRWHSKIRRWRQLRWEVQEWFIRGQGSIEEIRRIKIRGGFSEERCTEKESTSFPMVPDTGGLLPRPQKRARGDVDEQWRQVRRDLPEGDNERPG